MTTGDAPAVVRTGTVALNHSDSVLAGLVTSAEAKGPRIGGAALSADNRTLFTFAETRVGAIDTGTPKVRARYPHPLRARTPKLGSHGKGLYLAQGTPDKL